MGQLLSILLRGGNSFHSGGSNGEGAVGEAADTSLAWGEGRLSGLQTDSHGGSSCLLLCLFFP